MNILDQIYQSNNNTIKKQIKLKIIFKDKLKDIDIDNKKIEKIQNLFLMRLNILNRGENGNFNSESEMNVHLSLLNDINKEILDLLK